MNETKSGPIVELDQCILCEVCIDVCPAVFSMNDAGYIEVKEMAEYPTNDVHEAVKNCPADCITFQE